MSIKTSKRIALGVIASLVFAPFAAIAPASAATGTAGTNVTLTLNQPVIYTTVGTAVTPSLTVAGLVGATAGAATIATAETVPGGAVAGVTAGANTGTNATTTAQSTAGGAITVTTSGTAGASFTTTSLLSITPDVVGTYSIVFSTTDSVLSNAAGNSATVTLTIVAVTALPTTSLTTAISPTVNRSSDVAGTTRTITIERNSLGAATDGLIHLQVVATADATDLPVGAIYSRNGIGTSVVSLSSSGSTTTPQFVVDTTGFAAGSYVFRAFLDTNGDGAITSGELTSDVTITVVAASTAVTVSIDNATRTAVSGFNTFTITATVNQASGTLTVTESGTNLTNIVDGTSTLTRVGTTNRYVGTFTVTGSATGDYEDKTITVVSSGTGNPEGEADLRVVTLAAIEGTYESIRVNDVVGIGDYTTAGVRDTLVGTGTGSAGDLTLNVDRAVTSQTYTITAAAGNEGEYVLVDIAPTAGTALSVLAPTKSIVKIADDLTASVTVSTTAPAATSGYVLTVTGASSANVTSTVDFDTATPRFVVSPSAGIEAKYGDKIAATATLEDQFKRALSAKDITVTVAGRNAGTYKGTTAADGTYKFEWTDASASTVILTDSVTFSYIYTAAATSTSTTTLNSTAWVVTYSATGIVVGSVTVTAPSLTTDRPIDQSQVSLPHTSARVTYTATVKDADGAPVGAGALVTFTVGANDLVIGGLTQVTDEFGKASITVYRQKVGTATVSATAGGKASNPAGAVKWVNKLRETADDSAVLTADYHARYVSLTADAASSAPEGVIRFVAKVTDRFGNPVEGVAVTFTEIGTGRFMSSQTNPVDTNAFGEASIDMTTLKSEVGTMNVTVTITDANARQIDDIAGFVTFTNATTTANAASVLAIPGVTAAVKSATATATVAAPATPEVVVPPVAPTLQGSLNGRVLLFGACQADEGDMIVYVKSPGKAWNEKAKTFECVAGEFDGSIRAPKNTKLYRVKQEGTGLWSSSVLIRP